MAFAERKQAAPFALHMAEVVSFAAVAFDRHILVVAFDMFEVAAFDILVAAAFDTFEAVASDMFVAVAASDKLVVAAFGMFDVVAFDKLVVAAAFGNYLGKFVVRILL